MARANSDNDDDCCCMHAAADTEGMVALGRSWHACSVSKFQVIAVCRRLRILRVWWPWASLGLHTAYASRKGQGSCCLQAAADTEGMVALGKSWPADSFTTNGMWLHACGCG